MLTEDNIIDCGFLYIFYLFRMATIAEEFVAHHEAVQQHIQEELTNTSIISDAHLTEIRQHLLGNRAVEKTTKRKINRNKFILKTFVDDPDVVCIFKNVRFWSSCSS